MDKKLLTVGKISFIVSKCLSSLLAVFLSIMLIASLLNLINGEAINISEFLSIGFLLPLLGLILFGILDYLIIHTIIFSRTIYYDHEGLTIGANIVLWENIGKVAITFGQVPVLKIKYLKNGKEKNLIGILKTFPSKDYLLSIKRLFSENGIELKNSLF